MALGLLQRLRVPPGFPHFPRMPVGAMPASPAPCALPPHASRGDACIARAVRFPRMTVVMLPQLGAPTLGLRKRTPQIHLLFVGSCTYLMACLIQGH